MEYNKYVLQPSARDVCSHFGRATDLTLLNMYMKTQCHSASDGTETYKIRFRSGWLH